MIFGETYNFSSKKVAVKPKILIETYELYLRNFFKESCSIGALYQKIPSKNDSSL
jgi:hypothetical protein